MNRAWQVAVIDTVLTGCPVLVRGRGTLELLHRTTLVNMRHPVLTTPERKLGYRFMAAEAYWILSGDNRVESIAPYSKNIARFSDDGWTFFGAYGPKVHAQLGYVVNKLAEDPTSRQAVINIWRENPPETKDVPCTVAMSFMIRDDLLQLSVFMRSSDVWLGLPYDCFNFSMLGHLVCAHLNQAAEEAGSPTIIRPGWLRLTAASSHLYDDDLPAAEPVLGLMRATDVEVPTPEEFHRDPHRLMAGLKRLREKGAERWWE